MKKFIRKLLILIASICLTFLFGIFFAVKIIPPQFGDSYQAIILKKYEILKNEKAEKIIYVSNSSGAFCVNSEEISSYLDMPFINMGLHAGFGIEFTLNLVKENINPGDIIILSLEEDLYVDDLGYDIGLIVTGINDKIDMYEFLTDSQKEDALKYFPTYFFKKIAKFLSLSKNSTGVYNGSSFDSETNMVFYREGIVYGDSIDRTVDLNISQISDETMNYLKDFIAYAKLKGASVVLNYPSIRKESVINNLDELREFANYIENYLDIESINRIDSVLLSDDYLYDTIYHCNSLGETIYTESLEKNIERYIDLNN